MEIRTATSDICTELLEIPSAVQCQKPAESTAVLLSFLAKLFVAHFGVPDARPIGAVESSLARFVSRQGKINVLVGVLTKKNIAFNLSRKNAAVTGVMNNLYDPARHANRLELKKKKQQKIDLSPRDKFTCV